MSFRFLLQNYAKNPNYQPFQQKNIEKAQKRKAMETDVLSEGDNAARFLLGNR